MYMLYCDESGTTKDPTQKHFLFSGVSIFERQTYWLANELDILASKYKNTDAGNIEFHGSEMYGGRGFWRSLRPASRIEAIHEVLDVLVNSHSSNRVFVCVIKKEKILPKNAAEVAFEQLASRFDHYLQRLHNHGQTERGLIVFDKSTYEATIQSLAMDFRTIGYSWGVLRNLAEVPLFIDSKASRLIQLADVVSYSAFRYYERCDNQFFCKLRSRIDAVAGIEHGLYEDI